MWARDSRTSSRKPGPQMNRVLFSLKPKPPFRLDLTVWALRRRAHNAIDLWDGAHYRRALSSGDRALELCVSQTTTGRAPILDVVLSGERIVERDKQIATDALHRLLGLAVDLSGFYELAAGDDKLAPLADRFRGLKPPRFPSVFETLINALACQQLSLDVGVHLLSDLSRRFGLAVARSSVRAFPAPGALARLTPETLRAMKFSRQKAQAMVELSCGLAQGRLDLEALTGCTDVALLACLQALRGIGRWSAEYALLRGFGRLHVFPADDVGAWHGLRRWLGLRKPLDYGRTVRLAHRWHPYAGMVYFHLLLDRLQREGHLAESQLRA